MTPPLCRAKCDLEGEFLEGYICYVPTSNVIGIQTRHSHGFVRVIPKTIGRFTGRCDVAGKPIYEGDIVSYSTGLWVVEYNAGKMGFTFRNIRNDAILPGYAVTAATKVVGNTYENPEILRMRRLEANIRGKRRQKSE